MLASPVFYRPEGPAIIVIMKQKRWRRTAILLVLTLLFTGLVMPPLSAAETDRSSARMPALSPIWGPSIRQWEPQISVLASTYGFDPDFIAAVIMEESNGDYDEVSRVGAVGLMGVMPNGPGLEWRPSTDELLNPATNLRWGVVILSDVVRQSGGDLFSALAAYSGGWGEAASNVPRAYAASVLNNYGRAIVAREGISPDIATQWTIAIEYRSGNVPATPLLVLGNQPVSGLQTYGEHVLFDTVDSSGRAYYVKGYAVPVALVVPGGANTVPYGSPHTLEPELRSRLGDGSLKLGSSTNHVLLACLPSLSRLRGRVSTRWFAPSDCPSWHR